MKVGIVGHGFVGSALSSALNDDVVVFVNDPAHYMSVKKSTLVAAKLDFIFLCLPTPPGKHDSCFSGLIETSLQELSRCGLQKNTIVVIKSTITPNLLQDIVTLYDNLSIVYNPEFLTQNNATEDFINPNLHIFGGNKKDTILLSEFYVNYTKCVPCKEFHTDISTASLAKYAINSFLATKVTFMNHLREIHEHSRANSSFKNLTDIIATDPRIGNSHMDVPGPDGYKGFGGACLPKDTNAFIHYARSIGADFDLLEQVVFSNDNRFRYS